MILRRPYAFLIKHFKLIHLIITILYGYILIKTSNIYNFLRRVAKEPITRYDAPGYINYMIVFFIILGLALCFVVNWLLKYKDKPRRIYKIIIGIYAVLGIFLLVLFGYMSTFISTILEQKTVMLYRDIILITLLFQAVVVALMFGRALGFDIKKFDFNRDARELGITDSDSEEVEVNVAIDTTNIMRGVRKQGREFGYFFKEFKVYIIPIISIIGLIIVYNGYKMYNDKYKTYKENQTIGSSTKVVIKDSYYSIDIDKAYIIINFDIYQNSKNNTFNYNNLALYINNKKYLPDKNICYKFNKYGNCYKKQYLSPDGGNYILVYSLNELNFKKPYLLYTESYDNDYKVKLELKQVS